MRCKRPYVLLEDLNTLLAAHVVGNLSGKRVVVHEKEIHVVDVGHHKAAVAVGHNVARLLVRAVADLGHADRALEATANTVVNTRRLAPVGADTLEAVRLVAGELLGPLLHNRNRSSRHDTLGSDRRVREAKATEEAP